MGPTPAAAAKPPKPCWLRGLTTVFSLLLTLHGPADAALIAEYRFEETSYNGTANEVADVSGNGRHGRIVGAVSSTASGKTCRGISVGYNLDGVIAAFDTGIDVNTIGNAGTLTFWYSANASGSEWRTLFDATTGASGHFHMHRENGGAGNVDLYFNLADSANNDKDARQTNAMSDAVWTHVAVSWSATVGRARIYVNGVLEVSKSQSFAGSALHSGIGTLYFGDNRVNPTATAYDNSANGVIDQIRVYNHELTGAEVTADMGASPACIALHHLELTTASAIGLPGANVSFTVKACANADCSITYTGGVTGTLTGSGTGMSVGFPSGANFSIPNGSATTTVVANISPGGTVTMGLTNVAPVAYTSPSVYCGIGATAAAGNSCVYTTGPHHMELTTGSASGVACNPVTFTVKACSNADCSSSYTGGISGNLSVSGAGMTVNYPSGAAFSIAAGSSTTTVSAHVTTVGSVTAALTGLSITPSNTPAVFCGIGAAAASGASCTYTSTQAGLLFNVADHVAESSQAVTVSAVRSSDNGLQCTPAFASVSKTVNFKCTYGNPTTGTLPVRVGGAALNAANNAAAACDGGGRNVSLSFNASGVASTTVLYADVGQVSLSATYSGSGSDAGLTMTGSDSFVAAPSSFAFSAITAGNIRAGNNFSATVTARNASNAATPNFGRETSPATVTLTHTRASPTGAGASNGSFSGSLGSFSGGAATASNLSWTEVGTLDLTATLSGGNYLGSGLGATGSTGVGGAVGPFIPNHFTVAATAACSSFSYAGQPFAVTVTARNAAGNTTVNYDGTVATTPNRAKATTLSDAGALGLGSLSGASIAATAFTAGVATASPSYAFSAKQTAPQSLVLRATDTDATSSAGFAEAAMPLRSGRLRLSNAYGRATSALLVPVTAEYWSGASWVLNAADNCTSVPAASVVQSNPRGATGGSSAATSSASAVTLAAGRGNITLGAPSPAGASLSLDLALNLGATTADQSCLASHPASSGAGRAWLRSRNGSCSASEDRDPAARASFGIYTPETRKTVHVRELF